MDIRLNKRNALVGGSTSGLGRAIAFQLASSGATVTLLSHNEENLQQTRDQLPTPIDQQHSVLKADFEQFHDYQSIVTNYFEANRIDILVNNTNGPSAGNALEMNETDYQKAFEQLFQTVQFTTHLALKQMRANKYGRIINLTSSTVKEPIEFLVLSNTIRSALATWAKSLSATVAKDGITVNNILTGKFNTERLRSLMQTRAEKEGKQFEEVQLQFQNEIPMKRIGRAEEMGYLVTFLASEFSSYITGTNISIDGGAMRSL